MVFFVVAIGAKEHQVVLIQRDVGIVDVLDGEMDFVMDLVSGFSTLLAQAVLVADLNRPGEVPFVATVETLELTWSFRVLRATLVPLHLCPPKEGSILICRSAHTRKSGNR